MPRYTIRTIFGIILLVSVGSAVLFAFPDWLKVLTLLISVLALPGPLFVGWRRGDLLTAAFSLGALIAYSAWFVMLGIPIGWHAVRYYSDIVGATLTMLSMAPQANTIPISIYSVFAALYAPWIAVITGGLASLFVAAAIPPRDEPDAAMPSSAPSGD